jgi:hypothetical protein
LAVSHVPVMLLYLNAWLSVPSSYTSTTAPMQTARRLAVPKHIASTLPEPSVTSRGSDSNWELAAAAYASTCDVAIANAKHCVGWWNPLSSAFGVLCPDASLVLLVHGTFWQVSA